MIALKAISRKAILSLSMHSPLPRSRNSHGNFQRFFFCWPLCNYTMEMCTFPVKTNETESEWVQKNKGKYSPVASMAQQANRMGSGKKLIDEENTIWARNDVRRLCVCVCFFVCKHLILYLITRCSKTSAKQRRNHARKTSERTSK